MKILPILDCQCCQARGRWTAPACPKYVNRAVLQDACRVVDGSHGRICWKPKASSQTFNSYCRSLRSETQELDSNLLLDMLALNVAFQAQRCITATPPASCQAYLQNTAVDAFEAAASWDAQQAARILW